MMQHICHLLLWYSVLSFPSCSESDLSSCGFQNNRFQLLTVAMVLSGANVCLTINVNVYNIKKNRGGTLTTKWEP